MHGTTDERIYKLWQCLFQGRPQASVSFTRETCAAHRAAANIPDKSAYSRSYSHSFDFAATPLWKDSCPQSLDANKKMQWHPNELTLRIISRQAGDAGVA